MTRSSPGGTSVWQRITARIASLGLLNNALAATLAGVPALIVATPAQAACTINGGVAQNQTFTYTAATLSSDATINFPSNVVCNAAGDGRRLCIGISFTPTVVSGANSALLRMGFTDSTHGATVASMTSMTMYGPFGGGTTGPSTTVVTVRAIVPAGSATAIPAGTYTRSFQVYIDMTAGTSCPAYGLGGGLGDSAFVSNTANYVVPSSCQLISSQSIDFGQVSGIGPTASRIDADGSVTVNCNTPYTIYLGDGLSRVAAGAGDRQMQLGANRLNYQLYKDAGRNQIWDATGGTATTGGAGGVSGVASAANQTTPIFGAIPAGTALPTEPGGYSDTVIITVTY